MTPLQHIKSALDIPATDTGQPYLVESGDYLSLHFDSLSTQSLMKKSDTSQLVLPYTEAMLSFAPFYPDPDDILIVGLGGGSLSKYCALLFPRARITTVEVDERVIALRDKFELPADSEHFRVIHADAATYIGRNRKVADVILLDAYDKHGIPAPLATQFFYDGCNLALRDNGVVVANFSAAVKQTGAYLGRMRTAFDDRVLRLQAKGGGNVISLALKGLPQPDWSLIEAKTEELKQTLGFSLLFYVEQMKQSAARRKAAEEMMG
ncbi:fused MFS/spermidine synthase [Andreprevotia chitinilytica]|uniref:fused MFS/spermidine synthase n=1 Tax=Andreprevotia chitinilytica TaxID=396808 RepID=UPI00068F4897|nr:fused MFS/spermidine synthase [Andreprevotia chitinilytica]